MEFQEQVDARGVNESRAPRKRRRKRPHPNWPYRIAWLVLIGTLSAYIFIGSVGSAKTGNHGHPDLYTAIIARCLDATYGMWFFAVGASIGSFLNVVAYRLPLGRTLGGHSGCPYCCTPIASIDNVPVLAWLKLRGRCRQCHLPISIQYPLVEFIVGVVFLSVFLTEFARGGANLPGSVTRGAGFGVAWTNVNAVTAGRTFAFLFLISGLIGAALIAIKNRTVPMKLYAWLLLPWTLAAVALPGLIVLPWWTDYRSLSDFDVRLDSVVTIVCGLVMGVGLARLVAPLIYGNVDRTLSSSDVATTRARQWIGAMGIAGASVGWQSTCQVAIAGLLCQVIGMRANARRILPIGLADSTAWVWLGLLLVRANWNWLNWLELESGSIPPIAFHLTAVGIVGLLSWQVGKCTALSHSQPTQDNVPPDSQEPDSFDQTLTSELTSDDQRAEA